MIIDWYTIMFQIINFLILVFLLRYFLYGPIVKIMDEREQKIVEREEVAARQKSEAEKEAKAYQDKNEELQNQEEKIREQALAAAEKEKHELLRKARQEVDDTRNRWEDDFEREKETFIGELRRRIGRLSCSVARRCLQDLADSRLEELTWDYFLGKLEKLPTEELEKLKKALSEDDQKVLLRSSFDPPAGHVEKLTKTLQKINADQDSSINLTSKKDPELICGLELDAGGYNVAWNIESYLQNIEEQILKELEQQANADKTGEVSAGDKKES